MSSRSKDKRKELEPVLGAGSNSLTNTIPDDVVSSSLYKNQTIDFDVEEYIRDTYTDTLSSRSTSTCMFSLLTCGLGACWMCCDSQIVREGEYGVRQTMGGDSIILPPGRHLNLPFESFGPVQSIQLPVLKLGPRTIVTVQDGFRGESYLNGKLVVLYPGRHLLAPTHTFVKLVSMDQDEVDLGPKKIVTIKNGFAGIAYNKGVLQILKEGRHELNLPDERFSKVISLQQEVIELPSLTIKTTDNIQVICHAVLNYRIVDPFKAVTVVDDLQKAIEELAEVTLSSILRRLSFRDLSPTLEEKEGIEPLDVSDKGKGKARSKHMNTAVQARMQEDFHDEFEAIVQTWGVEIIGGIQLKTIEPKDPLLRQAIGEMAINTSKADATRRQAEFERQVKQTYALANKEGLLLAAQGEAESKTIKAQGDRDAALMKAKGEAEAIVVTAEAESAAIRLLSKARQEATENEGKAAEALTSPVSQQLAVLAKQSDILQKVKNPVWFPPESWGNASVWSKDPDTNTTTFFSNNKGQGGGDPTSQLLQKALVDNLDKK